MIRAVFTTLCGFLIFFATAECRAEPLRLLISVGHRSGMTGEVSLKHPTRDAARVRDVFVRLGGVRPENAVVLQEPTRAELFAAVDKLSSIARGTRPENVSLVFYFSGHGDREAVHLAGDRVLLRDLDAKLATVPAALRLVVTDACRTLEGRSKGVASDEPFAITVDGDQGAAGVVRVHATGDGEIAQESDELGGAVFTHFWLSGLSGAADSNGDAQITFSESYAWAYGQTLFRSARASGVLQRPSLETNLREGAPIVLTRMETASALKFPRAENVHYIVYGVGSRAVAAELWSSPARAVSLAIPPGKYIVHRRALGHSAAVQLDVGKGEQRALEGADFRAVPAEALARKGGEVILHPNELTAGYSMRTSRTYDVGHEAAVRYAYDTDGLAFGVGALIGTGEQSTTIQTATLSWLGIDASAELRAKALGVTFRAGGGPRALGVVQKLVRTDADRLLAAGYDPERRFRGTAVGGHAVLGARVPFAERFWLDVEGRGELLGVSIGDSLAPLWSVGAGAALGASF